MRVPAAIVCSYNACYANFRLRSYALPYTIEQLPGEPIVVVTYDSGHFDFRKDPQEIVRQITALANKTPERLAVIHDVTNFEMGFGDIIIGMTAAFQTDEGTPINIPNTYMLVVGGSDIVHMAIRGAQQIQYGKHKIAHFKTLEEAIQSARDRNS